MRRPAHIGAVRSIDAHRASYSASSCALAAALAELPSGLLEIVADAVAGQDVTSPYKWPSLDPLY